jgi:hypothetical protein
MHDFATMDMPATAGAHDMEGGAPMQPSQHSAGGVGVIASGCTTCAITPMITVTPVGSLPEVRVIPVSSVGRAPRSRNVSPDVPPPRA